MALRLKALGGNHQTGLHFNLTHGFATSAQGVDSVATLAKCRAVDELHPSSQAVGTLMLRALAHQLDGAGIRRRFIEQWLAFESYYGQPPAFVDGHQHVHAFPQIRGIVIEEIRQRNPSAWLRVPHASGFRPKVLVMRAMTAGLASNVKIAGLASNTRFAGFRPFCRGFNFALFFRRLLTTIDDSTLVMCHPGLAAEDPTDPIAHCRQVELDYFLSEQFGRDLAAAGVRGAHCVG